MKYTNLDNKKEIEFTVADGKKIIAIYGKNGVGKTTFSTNDFWDKKYVFNEVFIRENIYVTTSSGVDTLPENKNNFSSLFVGKDIIELKKKLEKLDTNKKELKDKQAENNMEIKKFFDTRISDEDIVSIASSLKSQIESLDPYLNYSELSDSVPDIEIKTSITDDKTFNEQKILFNSKEKLQSFITLIEKNPILNGIVLGDGKLDKYSKLLEKTKGLEDLHASKKKIDDFLKERKIDSSLDMQLIKDILNLQGKRDLCFLCGADERNNEISRWNMFLTNKYNAEQESILTEFKKIKDTLRKIHDIESTFKDEIPKTLVFLRSLENEIDGIIGKVKKDEFDVISKIEEIEFEKISKDTAQHKTDLLGYAISKKPKEIVGAAFQFDNIESEQRKQKRALEKEMEKQKETIVADVNSLLSQMQVNKTIQITIDRRGKEYSFAFTIGKMKVSTLSEGHRHKLALAFFITSIKQSGLENKTVLFDDPVVSLDELGYHVLRKTIIDLRIQEPTLRVIILTHNIFYLYVQLSNIFHQDELGHLTAFFRMSSTELKEYELNSLRIDDLTLFKKCYQNLSTSDELLILSGIVPKIFRQFIDLSLRIRAILFQNKPSEDIKALKLEENKEKQLLGINRDMNKISKNVNKLNVEEAKKLITLLHEATVLLGFQEYLTKDELSDIADFTGYKKISDDLTSNDIFFDMIDAVNDVFYREKLPEIREYLAHPRQQITKQITSISNDF